MSASTFLLTHDERGWTTVTRDGRTLGHIWAEPPGWAVSKDVPYETESYLAIHRPTRRDALAWLIGHPLAEALERTQP